MLLRLARARRRHDESLSEVPSKGISILVVNPEPIHVSSEEDEGFEIPLHPRSRRTEGPAVITAEALPEEVTERQATGGDSVPISIPTRTAPSSYFQS